MTFIQMKMIQRKLNTDEHEGNNNTCNRLCGITDGREYFKGIE